MIEKLTPLTRQFVVVGIIILGLAGMFVEGCRELSFGALCTLSALLKGDA